MVIAAIVTVHKDGIVSYFRQSAVNRLVIPDRDHRCFGNFLISKKKSGEGEHKLYSGIIRNIMLCGW